MFLMHTIHFSAVFRRAPMEKSKKSRMKKYVCQFLLAALILGRKEATLWNKHRTEIIF
jgi:hypothetical protein